MKRAAGAAPGSQLAAALVSPLPRVAYAALLILAAALAFIENTEPILDGDLFWHLAYAEQMVERGTLVPDATIYSWTPTSSATIYCAWASELLLYGLWSLGGLPAIFALRYAVVAIVLALAWLFARRSGVERALILILCLVVVAARTGAGTLPKPELFSLLLFTLVVFVYACVRSGAADGRPAPAWYFAVPALLVVWVNAHGGFILAAPFLAATAAGEILLFAARSAARLPPRALAQMLGAWMLCIPATIVTPYGLAYPVALLDEYAYGTVERPDTAWNSAYRSIFDPSVAGEGYVIWLVGILAGLAVLAALALRHRGRGVLACLPLGLALLCYVPLYAAFLRATQFLPIVAAFFALGVAGALAASPTMAQRPGPARGRATAVAAACAAIVAVATILESVMRPSWYGWPGWGIGENSPVAEAEFLARQPLGPEIYNIFDSGGYLLWRLYPGYRVMTDSRSFPYLAWFQDQFDFTLGRSFDAFLARYPADTAVIDLAKEDLWQDFMRTREWRPVFYGPTAVVFVKAAVAARIGMATTVEADPTRFAGVRSIGGAIQAFEFASFVGDYKVAAFVLGRMEAALWWQMPATQLAKARAYRDAMHAIRVRDFGKALPLLEEALTGRPISDRDRAAMTLLTALTSAPEKLDEPARQRMIQAIEKIVPVWPS